MTTPQKAVKQNEPVANVVLDHEDAFEAEVAKIVLLHRERNAQYRKSPLEILPIPKWLTQVTIKACRAEEALNRKKLEDELRDTAVYAIMVLEQILLQGYSPSRDE